MFPYIDGGLSKEISAIDIEKQIEKYQNKNRV